MANLLIFFGGIAIKKEAHTLSKNIFPLINKPKMTKLQSKCHLGTLKNGKKIDNSETKFKPQVNAP